MQNKEKIPAKDEIRRKVRARYTQVALSHTSDCTCGQSCCGTGHQPSASQMSLQMGYSGQDLAAVPEGANLGLGCGNPRAIACLQAGETVLDLGSGGGFDCFLAAQAVGDQGLVIGVDMTPEMVSKARANAEKGRFSNVEFRLGEIEHLPVADQSIDVIISNCVINLSPDKQRVFAEAYRVLKPGGRLAISDVVTTAPLPDQIRKKMDFYTGCVSGASSIEELVSILQAVGFENIRIEPVSESREFIRDWIPGSRVEDYIASATIEAVKPQVQ